MRQWLDHKDCTPAGTVLVHVEFKEAEDAEAFEQDFGG
jgi:hypothetical protein